MKAYYFICAGISAVLAIIVFIISGIGSCVNLNGVKKDVKGYSDLCNVRYYVDDTDSSAVVYKIVEEGSVLEFSINELPRKAGYVFAGFYDNRDFSIGTQYVDDQGEGIILITEDIVLYPIFTPIGGGY